MHMKKTFFTLVALVLVGGSVIAYSSLGKATQTKGASPLQSSNDGASAPASTATASTEVSNQFLRLLLSINSISISNELFAKPSYLALVDFSTRLESDGNEGRPNPFAPIGVDQTVAAGGTVPVTNQPNQPTQGVQSTLTTNPVSNITATTAIASGIVPSSVIATERYFEWGTMTQAPFDKKSNFVAQNPVTGVFGSPITNLTPNTTYSLRAVAKVGGQLVYGSIVTFKTLASAN
jgi:hypothetical protein